MRLRRPLGLSLLAALALGSPAAADEGWQREGASLKRGKNVRLTLTGYAQEDFRSFRDWEAGDEDTGLLRSEARELRRVRVGFEIELGRLALELDVDPRRDTDNLKDAYGELEVAKALRLRAGHFKLPVSAERLTSAARTDFVERAILASHIAPDRDWGVMLHGEAADWLSYQAGLFRGDGSDLFARAETTAAARLVVKAGQHLDLGASFSQGEVKAEVQQPGLEVEPKGIPGEGPSGFDFYESHFVNGTRRRLGFELTLTPGPTSLKGEWLRGQDQRLGQGSTLDDLPDQVATGWAVSASWLVTGEGKNGRVRPERPLFRGPGAVELAARYEELRFDDDGPGAGFEGAGSRARNIRPAADRVITGGLSWWPRSWLRLLGDVVVERFSDPLSAPEVGRRGNYVTLLGRLQVQMP
jgi:phosphate-selective porin OprO and OprP